MKRSPLLRRTPMRTRPRPERASRFEGEAFLLRKPERARSREHLRFVASQPCAVPGCRKSAQAHHLTIAQPKARGLKAGDNCAVPLCPRHHEALHARGDERAFWEDLGLDAVALAAELWAERHLVEAGVL